VLIFASLEESVGKLARLEWQAKVLIKAVDLVHFMVHNIVVKRVNIHDAKTNLSRYLAELTPGETLVVCNRNQPVAELRSLRKKVVRKPRIGAARGEFVVPDSFFEPLPDEIIKAFSGK
jgi:antitoxin (DNA-binding transcriptional repressor) of toxin-antitoxin stability system